MLSVRFYSQVLGLRGIPRPRNAGACLTNDEHSFEVHLIGEAEQGRVTQTLTPYRPDGMTTGHGSHPAFEVEIVGGPRQRGDGVQQVFICDPDGYLIELFVRER